MLVLPAATRSPFRSAPSLVCAGSIKGDVKRKHLSPTAPWRSFSDIQPLSAVSTLFARARFCFSLLWEVLGVISNRVLLYGFFCASKQRVGGCQPWFYLRLVAYGFLGLSEGHTMALETVSA
jgi:hypothetical protein